MKKIIISFIVLIIIVLSGVLIFGPPTADRLINGVEDHQPYDISVQAQQLHDSLVIGDWHVDSLLWKRDLSKNNKAGHLDIPRMQQGNLALQMFTTVTKSPSGLNYDHNKTDAADDITKLAVAQLWPISTWNSLTARAIHQSNKLHSFAKRNKDDLMMIKSQADLDHWQKRRKTETKLIGALLGTEGSHALDGEFANVQKLFDHGFRMMSLQHFFDNKLGASLHGESQGGLSDFGRKVVTKINQLNIILDVSHSSQSVVEDVLNMSTTPVVVSHTGFKGHCDTPRNISDILMQKIAAGGGLIAVGFWDGAVCGIAPSDIAQAIKYGIDLVGEDHISLGSDFDGSVTTSFDVSGLAVITQALLDENLSEIQVRKVMGGNMLRFLGEQLPH